MDKLEIMGLEVNTHIGVHEWEQRILQPLLIDICIPMDFTLCENSLKNTIDYSALCQEVTSFVEANAFTLIETVAEQVAALIKSAFEVTQLTIRISKPSAIKNAKNISVTLER